MSHLLLIPGAASGMDEDKVARDQAAENQVEPKGCDIEVGKKGREGDEA
jgi:hypothetical protein